MAKRISRIRVPSEYTLKRGETLSVQPALFDVSKEGERYQVSEAVRGLSDLGTGASWNTMGKMYLDGKEVEEY
jgi:hypothetical protein